MRVLRYIGPRVPVLHSNFIGSTRESIDYVITGALRDIAYPNALTPATQRDLKDKFLSGSPDLPMHKAITYAMPKFGLRLSADECLSLLSGQLSAQAVKDAVAAIGHPIGAVLLVKSVLLSDCPIIVYLGHADANNWSLRLHLSYTAAIFLYKLMNTNNSTELAQ